MSLGCEVFIAGMNSLFRVICLTAFACGGVVLAADKPEPISLWPGKPPGEKTELPDEKDTTKPGDGMVAGKSVVRLGNVSNPTISIYRPPKETDTGAAVVVCPGGAYQILAMDLEGTEVCEWLNSIGVTGVLLKYRVPKRAGLEKHTPALQDAQRAIGLVRHRAKDLGIDPKRIGVLGFSAGGHLAATACANSRQRTYDAVDDADKKSCAPDFAILIYPAYLTLKDQGDKMAPEVAVTTNTPQTFIAMTQDDPVRVEGALHYSLALKEAKVPFELHIYPKGGHGYGLRQTGNVVATWPQRATEWMRSRNLLAR
jgi:acetyl esterase/lipase